MMTWYIAFIAPAIWAVSNHIDKFIISRYFKGAGVAGISIFSGFVGVIFSVLVLLLKPEVLHIDIFNGIVIAINGALLLMAFIPYYFALSDEDASLTATLYQTIPIFSYILAYFVLGETLSLEKILAGILILAGAVFISVDIDEKFKFKTRTFILMSLSSLLIAVHFLIFKLIAIEESFWTTSFWEYVGAMLFGLVIFICFRRYRNQFLTILKENKLWVLSVTTFNEVINIGAKLIVNFASLFAPLALVSLANGSQPFFVFFYGIILTLFFPSLGRESTKKMHILQKTIAITLIFVGTYFLI